MTSKDIFGNETAPPHPGEILREDFLPHYGMTQRQVAQHLKISTRTLSEILREKRSITLDLAIKFGAAFGQEPHFWLGLQIQHDLWHARRAQADVRPLRRIVRRVMRGPLLTPELGELAY